MGLEEKNATIFKWTSLQIFNITSKIEVVSD